MIPSIFGHLKTLPKHPKSSSVEDELSDFQKSRSHCEKGVYISLKTNSSHLKIDVWKRRYLLDITIFRCYVSFKGGIFSNPYFVVELSDLQNSALDGVLAILLADMAHRTTKNKQ